MIEILTEYSIYGLLFTVLLAAFLTFIGAISGYRLTPEKGKARTRKFALVGAAIFFFCLPIFKPHVSSYLFSKNFVQSQTEKFDTVEKIAARQDLQSDNIEKLRQDMIDLKKDVYNMNLYYSTIIQLLSMLLGIFCFSIAFRKSDNNPEKIQTD
jgi:cytochrome bd-type quinol oxidase subunit 1